MAVLTANKNRPVRLPAGGITTRLLPLAGYTNFGAGNTAHTVYKGSLVMCDVSDTDGYFRAVPDTSVTPAAAGDIFGGIALEKQEVTSGDTADGSKKVTVAVDGVWGFPVGSIAITDIGAPAYASDDDTITTTATNNLWVGTIVDRDATYVWVDISHAAGRTNTAT
ncbi:hypothetical protein D6833_04170 [Candidatus Parcubacteria bacterium]|nr:MAG: hypothetical protein D6833_04170 [Candidatus Parcubacteria bacterium]